MHDYWNLFCYRTLHVWGRFTVTDQESSTVYTAIGICHADYADSLLARSEWKEFHPDLASSQSA
jgi:hypothetical protein